MITHNERWLISRMLSGSRFGLIRVRWFFLHWLQSLRLVTFRWKTKSRIKWNQDSNVIVSLTSFPERINHAWVAIESLFQQDFKPWKVVLVLSEQEFPTKKLPKQILRQQERGLEVLWVKSNSRSYMKLLPTSEKYPNSVIVTADDDICYESWRLSELVEMSSQMPQAIIGHRGWEILFEGGRIASYTSWAPAGPQTPSSNCFLTGVGMVLYPPHILPKARLHDINLAIELCPRADDIWFWAVAYEASVPLYCLGNHALRPVHLLKSTSALHRDNLGQGGNDVQLRAVIDRLNLSLGK